MPSQRRSEEVRRTGMMRGEFPIPAEKESIEEPLARLLLPVGHGALRHQHLSRRQAEEKEERGRV